MTEHIIILGQVLMTAGAITAAIFLLIELALVLKDNNSITPKDSRRPLAWYLPDAYVYSLLLSIAGILIWAYAIGLQALI